MYKKTALVAAGFLVMMGAVFVSPDVQAQTVNVTQVKSKIIKLKGNANQLRHASKSGWINITSKTKITKALRATKAIDVRKHLINKKGAVKVKDDLTVTGALTVDGTVNGITLSDLASDISALQTSSVYTAGSGLSLANNAFSLSTDCDSSEILKWDGDSWECATDATGGSGTTYTAGTGISISGSVISSTVTDTNTTYTAGTGITITSEAIAATLGTAITSSEITDGTIVSADIFNGTITADDLGADSVGASELSSSAIESGDIALGDLPAIASSNLSNGGDIALLVDNAEITGDWTFSGGTWDDGEVVNALTISGGTVNSTPIGATTASTGNFTNLNVFGQAPLLRARSQVPRININETIATSIGATTDPAPAVVTGMNGEVLVAYYDDVGGDLELVNCGINKNFCSSESTVTVDSTGDVGRDPSIILGTDGNPIIAYYDVTNSALKIAFCDDNDCATSTITTLDGDTGCPSGCNTSNDVGRGSSIAIGGDGFPIIAYYDLTATENIKTAHCDAATTCTGPTYTDITAAGASTTSIATSMTISTSDGFPLIAHIDNNEDPGWIDCTAATCATSAVTTLEAATVKDVSLTIGHTGLPILAYIETTTTPDVSVAQCNADACGGPTITDVASNVAATYVSMTVGVDGYPVVAYEGSGPGSLLQVMRCSSYACGGAANEINVEAGAGVKTDNNAIAIGYDGRPITTYYDPNLDTLNIYKAPNHLLTPGLTLP